MTLGVDEGVSVTNPLHFLKKNKKVIISLRERMTIQLELLEINCKGGGNCGG